MYVRYRYNDDHKNNLIFAESLVRNFMDHWTYKGKLVIYLDKNNHKLVAGHVQCTMCISLREGKFQKYRSADI